MYDKLKQMNHEDGLYFIDFEYASYGYRGFDIANHFNEYVGEEWNWSLYPSEEVCPHALQGGRSLQVLLGHVQETLLRELMVSYHKVAPSGGSLLPSAPGLRELGVWRKV